MMRIILLLTVFIFLDDITTILPDTAVFAEKLFFRPFRNATISPRNLSHTKLHFRRKTTAKTVSWKTRNLDTTTIRTLPWKSRDMDKFVKQLEEQCNFDLLNEIQYELKNLWDNVMQDEREDNLSKMDDVQAFFKKLLDGYNSCSEKKLNINSEGEWEIYMKIFGKEYPKGEKEMRKEIFKKKKSAVAMHNGLYRNGFVTYKISLNHFSDWTEEELKKMNGFRLPLATLNGNRTRKARNPEEFLVYYYNPNVNVPASIDWRACGYVNAVAYQGICNACYAIVGNGALEAYHKKKTGELVELSAQNILDCTWHLGNDGCNCGYTYTVFQYARSVGVVSDYWYPYTMNASHDCKWKYEHVAATDEGYYIVDNDNELALWHAVAEQGPVAAGIGINGILGYGSGVFYTDDCGPVVHAVLVVGYGTDPEYGEYWLVKNSWGFWWGDGGYIRIARNKFNVCSIASYAFFPY